MGESDQSIDQSKLSSKDGSLHHVDVKHKYEHLFGVFKTPHLLFHGRHVLDVSRKSTPISKRDLESLFGIDRTYEFPSLSYDNEGFATGQVDRFAKFDSFSFSEGSL